MRIGVFLSDVPQWTGGGYTFIHDVAEAVLRYSTQSRHQYTLLAPPAYAEKVRRDGSQTPINVQPIAPLGFWDRRVSLLKHYLPVAGYLFNRPSRLELVARGAELDLLWFVGGINETPDMPYVTTVWDVQHLTHPWFPEVSENWKWDHRELFYARHFRRATAIIVGTKVGRSQLVNYYGIPEDRVIILPHPTPAFALRASEIQLSDREQIARQNTIIYPAQFWPHKNHVNLLRALKIVISEMDSPPKLVLTGSELGNHDYISRCVTELGLSEFVVFRGFVSVDEMVSLYRSARALVYASFSGPENLPPLEAFALGCPVAASNYPGAYEQFEDAALLFDPSDDRDIARAIVKILTDTALRSELVSRGLARARQWTAREFVLGLDQFFDRFEAQRRCWP